MQCLPPSKVPREMKWHLALWADDPPHYFSDAEHSVPQEKASSLHSYHTVSSYKLNLIRSNHLSLMNKVPKHFSPCILQSTPSSLYLGFFRNSTLWTVKNRCNTQCCLLHRGLSPSKAHPHTYTGCCLPATKLQEEHSTGPRMPSLGLILNPHKSHLSSSLTQGTKLCAASN